LPDALVVQEAIRAEGLAVKFHLAADGERALDFLARAEKDPEAPWPQALLLDLNLPRIDGLEVLRRLRARPQFKDLPVVIVTSSDSPSDRSEAARLGARYFRKIASYSEFMKIGPFVRVFLEESGYL
jgi:chemotaxis family two-component system response regulator Rcp1